MTWEKSIARVYDSAKHVAGVGVLINNGRIVTCAHLLSDSQEAPRGGLTTRVIVDFPFLADSLMYSTRIGVWHPEIDIAGLELEQEGPHDLFPAPLVLNSNIWNLPYKVIGFPNQYESGIWAAGTFASRTADGLYEIDASGQVGFRIQAGFSGSPVWDNAIGGVAGIVSARTLDRQVAYVIPTTKFPFSWVTGSEPGPVQTTNRNWPTQPVKQANAGGANIFLCHASEDKERVRKLYRTLRTDGYDPWFDEEKLLPGQEWDQEIRKAVRRADAILVCLSGHSAKRGYVQKEIRIALDVADEQPEGAIFLIPARLEPCEVPDRLSRFQWVDLFLESGYEKLRRSLDTKVT